MMSDSESIINFTNSILHPCVPEILPENKTYGLDDAKFKKVKILGTFVRTKKYTNK